MENEITKMEYNQLQKEANQCMENILFLAIDKKQQPNVKSEEYQRCQRLVQYRKYLIDNGSQISGVLRKNHNNLLQQNSENNLLIIWQRH